MNDQSKQELEKELKQLTSFRNECQSVGMDKSEARSLIWDMDIFSKTFNDNYKHIGYHVPNTDPNYSAKYEVNKGLDNMSVHAESKLKEKDSCYFIEGRSRTIKGLNHLIYQLEQKLKAEE